MAVVTHFARKTTALDPDPAWTPYAWVWPYAWAASIVGVLAVGSRKISRDSSRLPSAEAVKLAAAAAAKAA